MEEDNKDVKDGQDTSTDQTSDTSSQDANQRKAEGEQYVPYSRFQEVIQERNTERDTSKEQITSMQTRIQELEGQVTKPAASASYESPEAIISKMSIQELTNAEIIATDTVHEEYEKLKPHLAAIKQQIRKLERNEVTNTLFSQDEKRRYNAQALNLYPDLANPNSEMAKKTVAIMNEWMEGLKSAGADLTKLPRLIHDSAKMAALELGIQANEAAVSAQLTEYDRGTAANRAKADMGNQTSRRTEKKPVITDKDRYMSQMFGTDPEKAAKIKESFVTEGFAEMEEK